MKPFDLEAFKAGKPALGRSGERGWYVGIDPVTGRIVAHVEGHNYREYLQSENADRLTAIGANAWPLDLTHMAPQKQKLQVWITPNIVKAFEDGSLIQSRFEVVLSKCKPDLSMAGRQICEVEVDV